MVEVSKRTLYEQERGNGLESWIDRVNRIEFTKYLLELLPNTLSEDDVVRFIEGLMATEVYRRFVNEIQGNRDN